MPDLTELELEYIRQIIFLNENKYQKIKTYLSPNARFANTTNV